MASVGHSVLHKPQAMQAFPILYANRTTSFTFLVQEQMTVAASPR